jgi:hypothetical protein
MHCNNCFQEHEELVEVCIPATLLAASESIPDERKAEILKNIDTDLFWEDMGKIVDKLEDGYYDMETTDA